jgi:hypothetical protein
VHHMTSIFVQNQTNVHQTTSIFVEIKQMCII